MYEGFMQAKTVEQTVVSKKALLTMLSVAGALIIPMMGFSQSVTGTLVNFILFATAMTVSADSAIIAGSFSATSALMKGALFGPFTAAIAPMIPFIIMGNALMVITYSLLKRVHPLVGIAAGSLLKFSFLYVMAHTIVTRQVALPQPILIAMSYPQLLTALTGGVVAYLFFRRAADSNR